MQVVTILSSSFLKLVVIAILVAVPFAWLIMNKWLQDFAYRIDLGAGIFIAAGLMSVSIALVTVSFQAIRAAMANPVNSLRRE
jgi:putative ABC transport system permease protein